MTFTGYVYKITGACGLVYIGSTNNIISRKSTHKTTKNNTSYSKLLKKPLKFDIIDTREYKLMKTLHLMEQFYLDNNNTINQRRAYTNKRSLWYLKRRLQQVNQYYYNNKEQQSQTNKDNYRKNRETRREKANEKIKCECGCLISRQNISTHKRSKKHIKLLNLLNSSV